MVDINAIQNDDSMFLLLADSIPQLAWMADPDGNIFWYNRRWFEYTGTTLDEMSGWGWQKVHDPNLLPKVIERWTLAIKNGDHFEMTFPLKGADGKFRPFLTQIQPFKDSRNNVLRWFGTNTDISEVEELSSKLVESEARFRQIADTMPQMVWVTTPDGYHEYYNSRWYEYIGCTPDQCEGYGWNEPLHPSDRQNSHDRWNHSLKTGEPYEVEYRFRSKEGIYRWFLGRALPIRNGQGEIFKWFGTCTDIDDSKKLEADRQRFVSLVENSTDFVAMSSKDLTPFFVNKAGRELVGMGDRDITKLNVRDFFFADDFEELATTVLPAADRNQSNQVEVRFRHFETGQPIWMSYRVFSLFDPSGKSIGYATVSRDMRVRKAMEDDLRSLAANLSEVDRRKTEFIATLGHELRNPLAPIRTGLEVMKSLKNDPVTLETTRRTMERQAQQLARLIDDLLDISRITQNKMELRKSSIQLGEILESAIDATKPMFSAASHEFKLDLPQQEVWLDADLTRLTQVVSNLLNNAAKYTPANGKIDLSATLITDSKAQGNNRISIVVQDNGLGIPADKQKSIFEMFSQIDRPLEEGFKGLGIGLTLAKRLVEMHDGSIVVYSQGSGQGSRFTVELPVSFIRTALPTKSSTDRYVEERLNVNQESLKVTATNLVAGAAATSLDAENEPAVAQSQLATAVVDRPVSHKVMVVDDNIDAAKLLGMMIKTFGNEVALAHDGQQAVEKAQEYLPEIVFMDIGMPRMNGYEAAKFIRSQTWGQSMKLIALTGWGQDEDRQKTKEAGFDLHLVKPVEPLKLRQILADL